MFTYRQTKNSKKKKEIADKESSERNMPTAESLGKEMQIIQDFPALEGPWVFGIPVKCPIYKLMQSILTQIKALGYVFFIFSYKG